MTLDDIIKIVEAPMADVKIRMDEIVNNVEEETTRSWMKYFLENKGHMLRPALIFLSYFCYKKSFNTKKEEEEKELDNLKMMAIAFEFLHTASLIHDDVIDEGVVRRGRKTINTIMGNKRAILIGNVFYLEAFRIAGALPDTIYFNSMINTSKNMCFGEIIAMENGSCLLDIEKYLNITEKKTAMLIAMCCREGARFARASQFEIDIMGEIGLLFGILYQLRDDIGDGDVYIENLSELKDLSEECYAKLNTILRERQAKSVYSNAIYKLGELLRVYSNAN